MFHLTVYVLKNGKQQTEIIGLFDDETNATQMKVNLLKTGQYKSIVIDSFELDSDPVSPLEVVKVTGSFVNGVASPKITAFNPTTPVADELTFNVSGNQITFTGYVNLDASEQAADDIDELRARVSSWVVLEFKSRLENDNPPIV